MPDLKVEWKEKAKVLQILVILFKKISKQWQYYISLKKDYGCCYIW